MLKLPGTAEQFLDLNWQKEPLFMPQAIARVRPAVTRNELGWLATLEDVESRLVFTERDGERIRYSAQTGPFEPDYLAALPKRDWTLLVHDVEKHLPAMRRLFAHVPFVPDWRIDDLMVSFAAPGGGVGPHRDNYDVFLCQGIGRRDWHVTRADVGDDPAASDDLVLTVPFEGQTHAAREGDVLYLPPGIAHWGIATRACITYSIGMRAPQLSDFGPTQPEAEQPDPFYVDPDLRPEEAVAGYLSPQSLERALRLTRDLHRDRKRTAEALGCYVTQTKDWITPERASVETAMEVVAAHANRACLAVHGMARIAWDDANVYVNGACRARGGVHSAWLESICANRRLPAASLKETEIVDCVAWMLEMGLFEIPES